MQFQRILLQIVQLFLRRRQLPHQFMRPTQHCQVATVIRLNRNRHALLRRYIRQERLTYPRHVGGNAQQIQDSRCQIDLRRRHAVQIARLQMLRRPNQQRSAKILFKTIVFIVKIAVLADGKTVIADQQHNAIVQLRPFEQFLKNTCR